MVYLYNGILLNHKKERRTDTCDYMDEPWKHYATWKKADVKIMFYDSIYMIYPE